MSVSKEQVEQALFGDDAKTLASTLCVIRAIYKLSFNYYLKVNGFTESDLNNKEDGIYRKLTAWPSQSRFIFSLDQMRDAYERLGNSPVAKLVMSDDQIEESVKRKKSKEGFWTLLGESEDAFESFKILEQDKDYGKEKLANLRLFSYAFRLVLFQTKISEFRETGNFLALLKSANRELAREAFRDCAGIVPLPASFFAEEGIDQEPLVDRSCDDTVTQLKRELEEKEDLLKKYRNSLQSMTKTIKTIVNDMQETKSQTTDIAKLLQESFQRYELMCNEIKNQ